jgi:hypothetical protein
MWSRICESGSLEVVVWLFPLLFEAQECSKNGWLPLRTFKILWDLKVGEVSPVGVWCVVVRSLAWACKIGVISWFCAIKDLNAIWGWDANANWTSWHTPFKSLIQAKHPCPNLNTKIVPSLISMLTLTLIVILLLRKLWLANNQNYIAYCLIQAKHQTTLCSFDIWFFVTVVIKIKQWAIQSF